MPPNRFTDLPVTIDWLVSLGGARQKAPAGNEFCEFIITEHKVSVGPGTPYPDLPSGSGLDVCYARIHPIGVESDTIYIEVLFDDFRDDTEPECVPLYGRLYVDQEDVLEFLDAVGAKYKKPPLPDMQPGKTPETDAFQVGYACAEAIWNSYNGGPGLAGKLLNPFKSGSDQQRGFSAAVYTLTQK